MQWGIQAAGFYFKLHNPVQNKRTLLNKQVTMVKPTASCIMGSSTKVGMIGEKGQRYKVQQEPGVSFRPGASCIYGHISADLAVQRYVGSLKQHTGKKCWRLQIV